MIQTRDIFVKLGIGRRKLDRVTTKSVDASSKITKPKGAPKKSQFITTADVDNEDDRAEMNKRLEIIAQRKKASSTKADDEKKVKMMEEIAAQAGVIIGKTDKEKKDIAMKDEKKPWKEMTDDEKKVAYKERALRAKATREAKKKKEEK